MSRPSITSPAWRLRVPEVRTRIVNICGLTRKEFLIGGAVLDEEGTALAGSIYIFEAEDLAGAPLYGRGSLTIGGTREMIIIRPWRQALFDHKFVLGTPTAGFQARKPEAKAILSAGT